MPNRFTQHADDSARLPEGMRRIAYDADSERYTFRDHSGQLYQSHPGNTYGELVAVDAPLPPRRRVTITERNRPTPKRTHGPVKSFDDILTRNYIAPAPAPAAEPTASGIPGTAPSSEALKRAASGVMRRSRTLIQRKRPGIIPSDSERRGLLDTDEKASFYSGRSSTLVGDAASTYSYAYDDDEKAPLRTPSVRSHNANATPSGMGSLGRWTSLRRALPDVPTEQPRVGAGGSGVERQATKGRARVPVKA
ncbi:hypothetical protein CONPUDRAFT_164672 [Coniophora puteana RWD-64-598 SS2]|uniref:Carbohydrate-binding module family 50 protein n=1 Tax=Coniophora puteana (strain RWD-64-598) TaxID=741705 RepID=A0A5M3MT93_CONPW|nr:uncharacterized protein CONPUDRAFT_164672 [Coniophora puteana RWD-64-598 SS2]EIW81974.1 hypothetical protein CONPUDRAFT_164672 [Coniophora puteana RWD-64-598 SS2]